MCHTPYPRWCHWRPSVLVRPVPARPVVVRLGVLARTTVRDSQHAVLRPVRTVSPDGPAQLRAGPSPSSRPSCWTAPSQIFGGR
jgi:hypothetical protein